jgi:predicted neuraminidase
VLVSYDSGRSWEARGHVRLASTWLIENTVQHVAETDDILMLFRTGSGAVFASRSSDDGRSWSQAAATSLPNPNSKLGMTTCSWHPAAAAPCLAVAYNHAGGPSPMPRFRSNLFVALSEDSGGSWHKVAALESTQTHATQWHYPTLAQVRLRSVDSRLH